MPAPESIARPSSECRCSSSSSSRLSVLCEAYERLVADRMPPGVVDLLEAVEVEDDERDGVVLARGAAQLGVEPIVEGALVRKPGERVLVRERLERRALGLHARLDPARAMQPDPPGHATGYQRRAERGSHDDHLPR